MCANSITQNTLIIITDLYKVVPDAVPPIHAESYHVAIDKGPSIDGGKFRSIFSDNLQPIATRGKKARGTLLVDKHCHNGCSMKRAPLSVSYYNEISSGHIWRGLIRRRGSDGPAPVIIIKLKDITDPGYCRIELSIIHTRSIFAAQLNFAWLEGRGKN